jgi:hypothetical protein
VLRKLVIAFLLAGLLAAPAAAKPVLLMPGVSYERSVQFTRHGPVVIHVLKAPRPGGLYELGPVLSNRAIAERETLTSMERAVSSTATVAGVNGDLFNSFDGNPSGILMQSGVLESTPQSGRSSLGIDSTGALNVARVAFFGTWQGTGQRRPLVGVNEPPANNAVTLFTPVWGRSTPQVSGTYEVVVDPFPSALPDNDLVGTAVAASQGGDTRIPPTGAVLVARGSQAGKLSAEAPVGTTITSRLILQPDWAGMVHAIGGGPEIVRDGVPLFRAFEEFTTGQIVPRSPRTAVGQLRDGRVILVVVDGGRPGYSVGVTNFELGQTMARLGVVEAMALDSGGSSTMAFNGTLLNRPADPAGERTISDGLLISYYGVYAPPPATDVLSPNGDGVGESQALSYKVVRPSTATARLLGPDGVARYTRTAQLSPGSYPFIWNGRRADGAPEAEGRWHWIVTAVDDQGRTSAIDRGFWLNRTLGFLRVSPSTLRLRPSGAALRVSSSLTRKATVTIRIETRTGAVVRTLKRRAGPGRVTLRWDGRDGSGQLVGSGGYLARVSTSNGFGPVDLVHPFTVRRLAGSH